MNRLTRSTNDRMVAGVCGGLGQYFNIDPTIIRIIWGLMIFSGVGLLLYILCAIIIPKDTAIYGPYGDERRTNSFSDYRTGYTNKNNSSGDGWVD